MTCLSCIKQKHMTLHVIKIQDNWNKKYVFRILSFMLHVYYIYVPIAKLCDFDLIFLFRNICVMLCVFI